MLEHPLRRQVVGEMHLRRWPHFRAPCLIVQAVRVVDEADRAREAEYLARLHDATDLEKTSDNHRSGRLSHSISFTWERHSEGSSLALFIDSPDASAFIDPRAQQEIAEALDWAENIPGQVVRATRIWVSMTEADARALLPQVGFLESDLVTCHVGGGARMWSDFRIQADGYGRLLMAVNGVAPGDISRTVQRIQELGNYRNMALLGLPVAQSYWQRLNEVEQQLCALGEQVVDAGVSDDALMAQTSALSLVLMSIATACNYRMSATSAYARLVEERLLDLDVQPIRGFQSLVDFTQRRFSPAVRTCSAFTERGQLLSRRAYQITSLLRTRIETRIEEQNARLLVSMERSSVRQLRLQQLVEGVSVVALSYYSLGIVSYLFKGGAEIYPAFPNAVATAVVTPFVIGAVWAMMHHLKMRILD